MIHSYNSNGDRWTYYGILWEFIPTCEKDCFFIKYLRNDLELFLNIIDNKLTLSDTKRDIWKLTKITNTADLYSIMNTRRNLYIVANTKTGTISLSNKFASDNCDYLWKLSITYDLHKEKIENIKNIPICITTNYDDNKLLLDYFKKNIESNLEIQFKNLENKIVPIRQQLLKVMNIIKFLMNNLGKLIIISDVDVFIMKPIYNDLINLMNNDKEITFQQQNIYSPDEPQFDTGFMIMYSSSYMIEFWKSVMKYMTITHTDIQNVISRLILNNIKGDKHESEWVGY